MSECWAIAINTYSPDSSHAVPQADIPAIEELTLLKEEKTGSIATRHEQPISHAPSNVYLISDEDIRHSGATDLPSVLHRVPGLDVMHVTRADFNVSARGDKQLFANKTLVMVDSRSIYIDGQGLVFWRSLPMTLLHRLRTRIDLFFNHSPDLINFQTVGTTRTLVNGGEADIYGTEAGIEFLATSWLTRYTNVSYRKIVQTFTGVSHRGGPDWKANLGLRDDWDSGLNGEVAVRYVAEASYPLIELFTALAPVRPPSIRPSADSYTLLNLLGGYRFWHDKAEVAVAGCHALHDGPKEHRLGDTLGSRVMGWVTLRY